MGILLLDVGLRTTDILFWEAGIPGENQIRLVVPSATQVVAWEIEAATRRGLPVLFRGPLMGGGASTLAMRRHVDAGLPFFSLEDAARTFSDDLEEVAASGVTLVDESELPTLQSARAVAVVRSGDVRLGDLLAALRQLGLGTAPQGYGVAVQDHGQAPPGMSDRVFRFQKLTEALARSRRLADLFFGPEEVPDHFTRLAAAASCVQRAGQPAVVGDTGPAALWGAALAASGNRCVAINFGNGHTLMSLVADGQLDGLFEHHTAALTPQTLVAYLQLFAARELQGELVLKDGGHGALPVSSPFSLEEVEVVTAGPRRGRFPQVSPHQREAGLFGDMMITGCYGLLEGYRARYGQA